MRTKCGAGLGLWLPLIGVLSGLAVAAAQRPTTRSPHGNLNISCENCHTFTTWKPLRNIVEFDHNKTSYPLRGMHTGVSCTQCHVSLVFTNVGIKCADCHADMHRGQFGARCDDCHSVKGWQVSLKSVREHYNRFPLVGAHATLVCDDCHKGIGTSQFAGLPTACAGCHTQDFVQTTLPNHQAAKFPLTCQVCHNMDSWFGVNFDHAKFTGFALTGVHATLECSACHGTGFQVAGGTCVNCHLKDYNAASNPNHVQAGFPQQCVLCHNTSNWTQTTFNHNTFTKFPLTGAHAAVACQQCHVNGVFAGTPTDCYSCHVQAFNGATNPNHVQAGFPHDCSVCHTTTTWSGAQFDHSKTPFPLTGAHVTVACALCHVNNNFTNLSTNCVSCHLKDFNGTTNPNHAQAGFPQQCEVCHSTASWSGAQFDHSKTPFPLTGAHITAACALCHVNNNFTNLGTSCVSCHLKDFNGTTNPNHVQAGFPQQCEVCHSTATWSGVQFDHSKTPFPLTGAHVTVACALCHVNNNFTNLSTACVSCHLKDFNGTTNPNHAQAGFPQDCSVCHNTGSWSGAKFDHNTFTTFPLTGAHVNVPCQQCHVNGKFKGTPRDCASCHLIDYQKTTDPNHTAAGFPTDCSICHTTASWSGAHFDHSKTPFPLTGAHVTVVCALCHVNNNFTNLSTACVSCHLKDYNGTTNPNHVQAGFPQQCDVCHNTTAWMPASFNHNNTPFPLTGAHVNTPCNSCHINGQFVGTPTDCYSCHKSQYQGTTDPNHVAAGFPTTCQTCHNTTTWLGATFNHTWFPTNHGGAGGVCSTCHTNPGNYAVFVCTNCHTKAQTDSNHNGVGGYVYNSINCYQCHKNGGGGGG